MKNLLQIDIDTDRQIPGTVLIKKPVSVNPPTTPEEFRAVVLNDMACLCEAVCTMIHMAEQNHVRPSAESLRECIQHLKDGFADSDYKGLALIDPEVKDAGKRKMRHLACVLLIDEHGIGEFAWHLLRELLVDYGLTEILESVKATDGRYYMTPEAEEAISGKELNEILTQFVEQSKGRDGTSEVSGS